MCRFLHNSVCTPKLSEHPMFGRADNLKQRVAIGAILLSLSTLAQHAGLYCYFGACEVAVSVSSENLQSCCPCHKCRSSQEQLAAHNDEPGVPGHESCPCPDDCWCHQPQQPFELPKSFDVPLQLVIHDLFVHADNAFVGGITEQSCLPTVSFQVDIGESSAVRRCARLCRFLI